MNISYEILVSYFGFENTRYTINCMLLQASLGWRIFWWSRDVFSTMICYHFTYLLYLPNNNETGIKEACKYAFKEFFLPILMTSMGHARFAERVGKLTGL